MSNGLPILNGPPTGSTPPETSEIRPCELTEKQKSQWRDTATMLGWAAPGFRHMFIKMLINNDGGYYAVMSHDIMGSPAATDGQNVIIDPDKFFEYKLPERVFIMGHEIEHNMYGDVEFLHQCALSGVVPMSDGTSLPFDNGTMQHAMDLRIDASLVISGIGKPPQISLDRLKGLDLEKTANSSRADQYKRLYKKKPEPEDGCEGDQPGPGKGRGGGFDNLLPPGKSTGQSPSQAVQQRNQQQWAVQAAVAQILEAANNAGSVPGGLKRLFKDILEPEVDWTEEVRAEVNRRTGSGNFNWRKGDRRFMGQDIFFPSQSGFCAGHLVIWGDTSGSRDDKQIASSIGEIAGIIEDVRPERLTVLWGDAEVANVQELDDSSDLKTLDPRGGGGTDAAPCLKWIAENCDEPPDMFLAFTDGYLTFPEEEPRYPVLWVMSTDVVAPWGKTIRVMKKAQP